jgi:hypothetical protein
MSKLPTILRAVGWTAFALLMVIVFLTSFSTFFMDRFSEGQITAAGILITVPICGLMFVAFGGLFGASIVSKRLKRLAAAQGKKVVARIVKTAYMGSQGSKHNTIPIYRFDLEVDYEGETIHASTEVQSRNLDESRFPPGTKVSAVYDHSTGAIAMLDRNDRVVEYF